MAVIAWLGVLTSKSCPWLYPTKFAISFIMQWSWGLSRSSSYPARSSSLPNYLHPCFPGMIPKPQAWGGWVGTILSLPSKNDATPMFDDECWNVLYLPVYMQHYWSSTPMYSLDLDSLSLLRTIAVDFINKNSSAIWHLHSSNLKSFFFLKNAWNDFVHIWRSTYFTLTDSHCISYNKEHCQRDLSIKRYLRVEFTHMCTFRVDLHRIPVFFVEVKTAQTITLPPISTSRRRWWWFMKLITPTLLTSSSRSLI